MPPLSIKLVGCINEFEKPNKTGEEIATSEFLTPSFITFLEANY